MAKLVRSRCLDIGQVLFLRFYAPKVSSRQRTHKLYIIINIGWEGESRQLNCLTNQDRLTTPQSIGYVRSYPLKSELIVVIGEESGQLIA